MCFGCAAEYGVRNERSTPDRPKLTLAPRSSSDHVGGRPSREWGVSGRPAPLLVRFAGLVNAAAVFSFTVWGAEDFFDGTKAGGVLPRMVCPK